MAVHHNILLRNGFVYTIYCGINNFQKNHGFSYDKLIVGRADYMRMENQFWFLKTENLHYDHDQKKWVHIGDYTGYWLPGIFPCHSYKAARRHLKQHNEIPVGTKFTLVSAFVGQDRTLVKKKK